PGTTCQVRLLRRGETSAAAPRRTRARTGPAGQSLLRRDSAAGKSGPSRASKGPTPPARDSARARLRAPCSVVGNRVAFARRSWSWGRLLRLPEAVAGLVDEDILQRRLAERDRRDPARKRFDDAGDPFVPVGLLEAHAPVDNAGRRSQACGQIDGQLLRVVGLDRDRIAADSRPQRIGRVEGYELSAVQDGDAVGL